MPELHPGEPYPPELYPILSELWADPQIQDGHARAGKLAIPDKYVPSADAVRVSMVKFSG